MAAAPGLSLARTGWFTTRWRRLNQPPRLQGLDLARGAAVLGMFAAHLLVIPDLDLTDTRTWTAFVEGRSSILFATIAGVSLALLTGGSRPFTGARRGTAAGRLALRAVCIWALGLVLISLGVPIVVILPAYAVLFLLALPFLFLTPRVLFLLAAVIAVVMPWPVAIIDALPVWSTPIGAEADSLLGWHYPFAVWIAFVLAGVGIGRLDLDGIRTPTALVGAGTAIALAGYGAAAVVRPGSAAVAEVWSAQPHSSGIGEIVGSGGVAIAVIGACLLVCASPLRWLLLPLRAVGSMPLTAYTAQIIGWWVWTSLALESVRDQTGFRALDPFWPFAITTIVGCTAWALLVGRGPLEWLVDRLGRAIVGDVRDA